MARTAKKKPALTPEEKLEQALVPEAEQPYKAPENWCWIRLGSISTNQYGYTAKAVYDNNHPKMLRITDIQENGVDWHNVPNCLIDDDVKKKYTLKSEDIVIARTGATTGKSYMFIEPRDAVYASYLIRLRIHGTASAKFIYSFLQSNLYWKQISELSSGIAQPGVNSSKLLSLQVPFPPLPEQHRIVTRIESLFAKLDEAREKAQAVVDGFEDRKAAILHKAFTGELTKGWRKENGLQDIVWDETPLEKICSSIYDGDHMPPPKSDEGIPFLVISNVNTGHLSYENTRFVPHDYYESISDTRKPELGDVLYTLVGSYGIPVVVDDSRPFCFQRHMALLKPVNVDTYFLWYQLQCQEFYNKATEIATGTAQLTVPIKGLRKLKIRLPSKPEQSEVVKILNGILSNEEHAKETAEQVIDQIDTMKKSILARAFRGELGTNDPEEESAVELVRRVL